MIRTTRSTTARRRAAAVLVTAAAAAVLLTSCSSGSDSDGATAAKGGSSPTSAASAPSAGSSSSATPSAKSKASGTSSAGPRSVVPDSQLTPATGSFTKKQKKYLSGRVPKGNDPAAILQTGQETCDRIASVARIDRDAVVGAIITGDIAGAADAITILCPKQKPVLADTVGGLSDGTTTKPAAGRYRALTPTKSCNWQLGTKSGTKHTVTIAKGTKTFTSTGCYAWMRL